ncbi:HvnC protein [Pseudomonas sp. RW3S2]|uniref:HvnC protein n=1 Tax=Pseudomonas sp. RW3S2 TaxID=485884 RepID=UPI001646E85F|nr:HvnC protein [Pseudomonas sp. RW3S2]MBC3423034.1 HvnC protein [Pseudomonas sp. RW3S2]
MRTFLPFTLAVMIAACAKTPELSPPMPTRSSSPSITQETLKVLDTNAENALQKIDRWFRDSRIDCGSSQRPAFLCSGVLIRVTQSYQSFDPWEPSPRSISRQGVSASWLRQDSPIYSTFKFRNGFILYPVMERPAGKAQIHVKCTFPRDAATDNRMPACSEYAGYPASKPCNEQGINTAEDWKRHYDQMGKTNRICGWNVSAGITTSADRFYQSIRARSLLAKEGQWNEWNELILEPWHNINSATLPLLAFFYQAGNMDALNKANHDQQRYYQKYGQYLPVVSLSYSTTRGLVAHYNPDEQGLRQQTQ